MSNLLWLDFETTGLNPRTCAPIEVAAIVTNSKLEALEEYQAVIYQPQHTLNSMNDFCKNMHTQNALLPEVPNGKMLGFVEQELSQLIVRYFPTNPKVVLCGNTINFDRGFIEVHMPQLHQLLHYRTIDVSAFKEYFKARFGWEMDKGVVAHRALPDIRWSIKEMLTYDQYIRDPRLHFATTGDVPEWSSPRQ